jgi:TrmH family RNA methyltransferase
MALTKAKARAIRSLQQKKFRDETGTFVVEGVRLTRDAVASDFEILDALYTAEMAEDPAARPVLERLRAKCRQVEQVTAREMEQLAETVSPPGMLAVLRQKHETAAGLIDRREPTRVIVALDGVADPGNVGSIVRTCDWFGVDGVLLGRNSVDLYNPKVVRATMGGMFHLPVVDDVDLLPVLTHAKSLGYTLCVTDPAGETHHDRVTFAGRTLIVFGNEARGVSDQVRDLADSRVTIRRYGAGESLNVAVACGIVLSRLHQLIDA